MVDVAFGLCDWKRVCWKVIVLYSKGEYGIIKSKVEECVFEKLYRNYAL